MARVGPYSDDAHAAIAAELVAVTLGVRRRPELVAPLVEGVRR